MQNDKSYRLVEMRHLLTFIIAWLHNALGKMVTQIIANQTYAIYSFKNMTLRDI